MFQFSTSGTVGSLGYETLGHMFAPGKRSERHPTPRGCGQLNKCEPTNLPAHSVSVGRRCPPGGGSVHGVEKVWGRGNPLGAGGSSGSSSVCLRPTLHLLPSLAPPALPICAGTRLEGWSFSGQQRWTRVAPARAPSRRAFLTPVHPTLSHAGAFGVPHPLSSPSPWPPQCQANPCSSRPGPGVATGVPLVSGLLSAQQQLFLLRPERIPWAPLPQPWVPPRMPALSQPQS